MLKIAKPFVDVLTNGAKDEALAQAVVALAHSLELEVVAEGVEQEGQLELLRGMGCELGQGFIVSPAVPATMLPGLVSARREAAGGIAGTAAWRITAHTGAGARPKRSIGAARTAPGPLDRRGRDARRGSR